MDQNTVENTQENPDELVKVSTAKVTGNESGFKVMHRRDMSQDDVLFEDNAPSTQKPKKENEFLHVIHEGEDAVERGFEKVKKAFKK